MNDSTKLYKKYETQKELWLGCRFLLADVPVDTKAAKRYLPLGMSLTRQKKATLFVVDYTKPNFTAPYKEAGLLLHVKTLLGRGLHCCWMVVNDDTAMIYGRELLGYPKKMAELVMMEDKDRVKARVKRRGVTILKMEGTRGQAEAKPQPVIGRKIFNASGPGQMLYLQPLWLSRPRETISESYRADVSVTTAYSECDPIATLISGPATNGRLAVTDIPGAKYMFPFGFVGPVWLRKNYFMRYR